jgi:hypothetical protein
MTEADIQRAAIQYLVYQGFLVIRINSGAITQTDSQTGRKRHHKFCTWHVLGLEPQSAGVNDILALEPGGRLWIIECKAPGKLSKMTEGQIRFQAEGKRRGAVTITIDDPNLLIEAVEKFGLKVLA